MNTKSDGIVVLSGCSGGGKSTLLDALEAVDFTTIPEAGRIVVRRELENGGSALPWVDLDAFMDQAFRLSLEAFDQFRETSGPIVADRSIVDLLSHYEYLGKVPPPAMVAAAEDRRYAPQVFMVPPWREIYVDDAERNKPFETAVGEYEALVTTYRRLGYRICTIPKNDVERRLRFVRETLNRP